MKLVEFLYIHLDNMTNSVYAKGFTNLDFQKAIQKQPENLLLLDPHSLEGEFEAHTGLKIVRGPEKVAQYFKFIGKQRNPRVKWIDFADLDILKELTAIEISELLYFGHMKMQLHSPFFYKLQNDYVFFEMADQTTKIYYRHLEEFYRVLSNKLRHVLLEKLNDRKTFFRRQTAVEPLSHEFIKQLKPIFQEGVVLSFEQATLQNKKYHIPIYLIEDRMRLLINKAYLQQEKIATLIYDAGSKSWSIQEDMNPAILYTKQA